MADTFECAVCGGVFIKTLTEDEADKQFKEEFSQYNNTDDCVLICDDCYQAAFSDETALV